MPREDQGGDEVRCGRGPRRSARGADRRPPRRLLPAARPRRGPASCELAVPAADPELEPQGSRGEVNEQVTGLLGSPGPGPIGGDAQDCTVRVWISIMSNTYTRLRK